MERLYIVKGTGLGALKKDRIITTPEYLLFNHHEDEILFEITGENMQVTKMVKTQ